MLLNYVQFLRKYKQILQEGFDLIEKANENHTRHVQKTRTVSKLRFLTGFSANR